MASDNDKPRIGEEIRKIEAEPLLPIEKKLIAWSLILGVVLLAVLVWTGNSLVAHRALTRQLESGGHPKVGYASRLSATGARSARRTTRLVGRKRPCRHDSAGPRDCRSSRRPAGRRRNSRTPWGAGQRT